MIPDIPEKTGPAVEGGRSSGWTLGGWLRGLSSRAEFSLMGAICFGYLAAASLASFFRGRHVVVSTNARIAWLFAFELLTTAAALLILRVRGVREVFGRMRFSIAATSRGALLWIALMVVSVLSALVASALVRFLYHTYQGWMAVLTVLPLGVLFGIEYWRKRNLYPLILAHTAVNVLSFLQVASRLR